MLPKVPNSAKSLTSLVTQTKSLLISGQALVTDCILHHIPKPVPVLLQCPDAPPITFVQAPGLLSQHHKLCKAPGHSGWTQLTVPQGRAGRQNILQPHGSRSHCSPSLRGWRHQILPITEPHNLSSIPHLPHRSSARAPGPVVSHLASECLTIEKPLKVLSCKWTNTNPPLWLHNDPGRGWGHNNISLFSLSWKLGIQRTWALY